MTSQPERPFGGGEYPPIEQYPPSPDPYAPVDYPTGYSPLPPPIYTPPSSGYIPPSGGYPPPLPGYSPAYPSPYPGYDPYDPYRAVQPPGTNSKAIAALVLSLVGFLCCGLPSIAGLILGVMAMRETKSTGQDGYGLALAGAIIGGAVVALYALYLILSVAMAASGGLAQ